jgi:hypothetical protein
MTVPEPGAEAAKHVQMNEAACAAGVGGRAIVSCSRKTLYSFAIIESKTQTWPKPMLCATKLCQARQIRMQI